MEIGEMYRGLRRDGFKFKNIFEAPMRHYDDVKKYIDRMMQTHLETANSRLRY